MNKKMKTIVPNAGEMISITERKVSGKLQPKVKRGNVYVVDNVTMLKSGAICLVCHMYDESEDQQVRINAERFGWRIITKKDIAKAEKKAKEAQIETARSMIKDAFDKSVAKTTQDMMDSFSWQDHMMISFVPLVISEVAWIYAERARRWCADNRIEELKGLSRAIQKVRKDYMDFIGLDLDREHINNIAIHAEEFMSEPSVAKNFTLGYFTLRNEYQKQYKDVTFLECRALATMAILMIEAYTRHNSKMNDIITEKMGGSRSIDNPLIAENLFACMDALRSNFVLKKTAEIVTFEKIFDKSISMIEFEEPNEQNTITE